MKHKNIMYMVNILFLLCVLLLTGCTEEHTVSMDGATDEYQNFVSNLKAKIKQLEKENERLTETIRERNMKINELEKINYQYFLDEYYYEEEEIQTMLGYMQYNGEEPLRALPYSDAIEVNKGRPAKVKVISTVRNKYDEHWALVYFRESRRNNYGFVKVEHLEELEEEYSSKDYSKLNIPISIEGIKIGDSLEKAISVLGRDYVEVREAEFGVNHGGFIHYGKVDGSGKLMTLGDGIDIFYSLYTHSIWYIRIECEGYYTSDGFSVGSNAKEAIDYYKSHYPVIEHGPNFDENSTYFDVGDDYGLRLDIDTEELTKESKIKRIELAPVWWFGAP
ncbi:MAG: hypothetical protein H0Z35_10600 [Thermoanaerobacteraceae bacterium]|nr:hypothetical protein [Thermoanaerobacteraceae bacterium]